jgi:hypothetical protein
MLRKQPAIQVGVKTVFPFDDYLSVQGVSFITLRITVMDNIITELEAIIAGMTSTFTQSGKRYIISQIDSIIAAETKLKQQLARLCYYHAATIVLSKKDKMETARDKEVLEEIATEIRKKTSQIR